MIVEERDRGRSGLVNLAQILHAWIVGRHLLDQQIGITEDDREAILELVFELGLLTHRIPADLHPSRFSTLRQTMGRLLKHRDKLVN